MDRRENEAINESLAHLKDENDEANWFRA